LNVTLSGKTAVVTGAMSGIGLAITHAYLEAGAQGLIAVSREAEIPSALRDCAAKFPGKLHFVQGDVADEATAQQFTHLALDRFGHLDILVNNAGISVVKALHEHSIEEWDAVLNSNVKALFLAARHVVPVMMNQKQGLILVTGSISGEVGIPTQGAYAASKGALHQMTRQMAIEYAPFGIRVNTIACGTVDTPIVHNSAKASGNPEAYWKMLREKHPIGRIATSDEVAAFFTYMASDYATFFTGSILMLDGGFTAQ
jgi:NAD(P)-dependent dehydrogenase (short-subunit alcohol dehydrogenase family)